MARKLNLTRVISSVFKEKCPHCNNAPAFKKGKGLLSVPEMHESCGSCSYKFEREPGFFIGAIYLSYGFAVLEGVITFLLVHVLFPEMTLEWKLVFIISSILLFSKKNFIWARLLYIHIFPG
jgi:hypothetical protein